MAGRWQGGGRAVERGLCDGGRRGGEEGGAVGVQIRAASMPGNSRARWRVRGCWKCVLAELFLTLLVIDTECKFFLMYN